MRYLILALLFLTGCAAWQAGIDDPEIVSNAIHTAEPYKQIAEAAFPKAGIAVMAILVPLLVLLGGKKKLKNESI